MVKVRCRTNLDDLQSEKWPDELPARPVPGDYITAASGLQLKVQHISFDPIKVDENFNKIHDHLIKEWSMDVWLGVANGMSIGEFNKWYREVFRR